MVTIFPELGISLKDRASILDARLEVILETMLSK